jgi:hypothetical protein
MPRRPLRAVLGGLTIAALFLVGSVVVGPATAQAAGLRVGGTQLSGGTIPDGSTVRLSAPGAVSVSWVLDGVYLGRDTRAPFQLTLATRPGAHKVKARSEAGSGRQTTYEVRFHTVAASPTPSRPDAASSTSRPSSVAGTTAAPSRPAPSALPTATAPTASTPTGSSVPPAVPARPAVGTSAGSPLRVDSSAELRAALAHAMPGQVIELADAVYEGRFVIDRSGSEGAPIVLRGSSGAVLDGGAVGSGYTLHLDGADHVRVEGVTVRGGQKGVVLDEADHVVLSGLDVGHTGMEAVHFRTSSSDDRLEASAVHDTGLIEPAFGEGVYIGSATSNWGTYGDGGGPDRSDRNVVVGNRIYEVTAENIDVKEGTTGGVISGNNLDGAGLSGEHYADSWIDLKGNGYLVADNIGVHSLLDGFQTHVQLDGWGQRNVFRGNRLTVGADGVGINVHRADVSTGNVVACDNLVVDADLANVPCR